MMNAGHGEWGALCTLVFCELAKNTRCAYCTRNHKAETELVVLSVSEEKPSASTAEELAIMRTHPETGYEALCKSPDVQPELLDIVRHHHEYLDGSGYPHGLMAPDISDLVREFGPLTHGIV